MKQSMKQQNQKEGAEPKQPTGRDKRMCAEIYATEKNARVYLKKAFRKLQVPVYGIYCPNEDKIRRSDMPLQ